MYYSVRVPNVEAREKVKKLVKIEAAKKNVTQWELILHAVEKLRESGSS